MKQHLHHPIRKKSLLAGFLCLFSLSACLKTRGQLKEQQPHEPVPAKVQKVEPSNSGGSSGNSYAIEELRSEIMHLKGRIQNLEEMQAKAVSSLTDEKKENLEKRIMKIEQAQQAILTKLKDLEEQVPKTDPIRFFKTAKEQYESANYEDAIQNLTAYLESEEPEKKKEALFLRAESYFETEKYKKAIVDYSKFPEQYDESEHVPEALFKIGQSFDSLGMNKDAKAFYQELINQFPDHKRANQAKVKMKDQD